MSTHRSPPGTVLWAAGLTALHALLILIGVFVTLANGQIGWLLLNLVMLGLLSLGAYGLLHLEPWARYLVLTLSALSWIWSLSVGRIDVISTNVAVFVLLLLPSAREAFEARVVPPEGGRSEAGDR